MSAERTAVAGEGIVEFAAADVEGSIPARFAAIAARHPGLLALAGAGHRLTYDVGERLGAELPVAALLAAPTITAMADAVVRCLVERADSTTLDRLLAAEGPAA